MTTIYSKNNHPDEIKTVEIVKGVCEKYQVPLFTQDIVIEKGAIPHSHPILTLNTRESDERLVLKTLVHEQFHWHAQDHKNYDDCIAFLKTKYEDDGEHNKSGTYPNSYWEHVIVCFNTRNYLKTLLAEDDMEWVYAQWQPYPTLEKLVEDTFERVEKDLQKFEIIYS